jgi:hypothetical protein
MLQTALARLSDVCESSSRSSTWFADLVPNALRLAPPAINSVDVVDAVNRTGS